MTRTIHNVLLAGATGSVGAPILTALLAEPSFNVTILSRKSSSAELPPNVPIVRISDDYSTEDLILAFQGQDAVISALGTTSVTRNEGTDGLAYRLIDAALAAGVKRFIPSEFGANNLDPRPRSLVPVYNQKGAMLEYLIAACSSSSNKYGLTWTSVSCGLWLDWALDARASGNFLGIDVAKRTARVYDSGRARFAVTTSSNAGLAIARVLLHAELTANKQIFLSDFTASTLAVVEELERQTNQSWHLDWQDSAPEISRLKKQSDMGDFNATYQLLPLSFSADVDVGYDFEAEQDVWNDKLSLPQMELKDVVAGAIKSVDTTP